MTINRRQFLDPSGQGIGSLAAAVMLYESTATRVDSGQEVCHYSGQNCSGRVVAEWNFGRHQRLVSSGRKAARNIRDTAC